MAILESLDDFDPKGSLCNQEVKHQHAGVSSVVKQRLGLPASPGLLGSKAQELLKPLPWPASQTIEE